MKVAAFFAPSEPLSSIAANALSMVDWENAMRFDSPVSWLRSGLTRPSLALYGQVVHAEIVY